MNKKTILLIIGAVVVVGLAFAISTHAHRSKETTNTVSPVTSEATAGTPASGAGGYTLAQVATHTDASSCWTAINGGVYDVTPWIPKHPGGSDAILYLCGKDGSAAFDEQHGGQARPANELASFKIGVLVK